DAGKLRRVAEQGRRIDALAVPARAEMQVRSGRAPGLADRAERIATLDLVAGLDLDRVEVEQHRHQAATVVDDHGLARIELVPGQRDGTVGRRRGAGAFPER